MSQRNLYPFSFIALTLFSAGCATGGTTPGPVAATPVVAPPETVVVEISAPAVADVEPGRFDTGKMWTFENPPLDYFQEAYDFRPTEQWFEQVRLAALRLPNCTASFVSPDGLVMSNHHCARESATAVSRDGEDLLEDGFYAASAADERYVPDLYVDQLVEIHDVTELVSAAVDPMLAEEAQVRARDQRSSAIADSAAGALGLRCDVTSLYHGGKYSLYCYKRYNDIRLVFVPEIEIGYFGGDPDNFTYPRYVVDVSFFRVYDEEGSPLKPAVHLSWSTAGVQEGDPVFVIGNPGSTSRLNTVAQLEYKREVQYPFTLRLLESRADLLWQFMDHHPEERSEYINDYFSLRNSLKAITGELKGLRTPELLGRKIAFERQFREAVERDPARREKYGGLWDEIAEIRQQIAEVAPTLNALNQGGLVRSQLLATASTMIQYAQAATSGAAPDSVLQQVRDELEGTSFNTDLDAHMLELQLEDAAYLVGDDDPFVRQALMGRSAADAARAIVEYATALTDSAKRAALLDNPSEILNSPDPALALMRDALPRFRQVVAQYQQLVAAEEIRTAKLARALFDVYGSAIAPDATFTLRIADGVVTGYEYNGTQAPAFTTFYGMYDRHYSNPGDDTWALPERWLDPPAEFPLGTPLNMVSTNDIIGGNSGSPVINTDGQLVGLIFDGNIESLPGDFIYTTETARAIAVRAEAIIETLRHIYGADRIVDELLATARN